MRRHLLLALLSLMPCWSQQWQQVTSIPAPYNTNYWLDVFFLPSNPRYGWICGFNGMVIRTTDGGQTWQGTQISGAYQLESIHFVNPQVGYTSGPDGIWRSTDGGATWTEVTPDSALALWGCYFLSPTTGMVIGGGCGSIPQRFFRTTNGGASWSFFTGNEPNSGLTDLLLFPDGSGFAVSSGRLWRTSDSGQTWQVFATTGSAVWQEEITRSGSSFLLPFAGTSCSGQGNTGGMRFSTDGGTTWREFVTGKPMFGAFLLNPTTGWACGYNGALYYTSDGGQTWQLRNCGIDTTRHLDDIWFVNDTLGWVVGQGVWRYAGPERRFERDTLLFPEVCLPGSVDMTVRLENRSFTQSLVNLSLTGTDSAAFQLVQFPLTALLQPCSWTPLTIRFQPSRPGLHRAQLVATFPDGMVRRLWLLGIARTRDGFPEKDTLLIPAAPCGIRTQAQLTWRSRDSAALVRIDWIGGSAAIRPETPLPLAVPPQGTALTFSVLPLDTGWTEARFRVRLQPCSWDTVIVVRAYGISPILTAASSHPFTLRCQTARVDSLPIANTGNDTLWIPRMWIDATPPGSITILGWSSRRNLPLAIPPKAADTLLLLLQPPSEGTVSATLWLENNDSTKVRGQKNPFRIELLGEARRTELVSQLNAYDFGRVCLGQSRQVRIRIENRGTLTALLSQPRVSMPFAAELEDRRNPPVLLGKDSVGLLLHFQPVWEGVFVDTVVLTATPCGERITIAVRGEGIRAAAQLTPGTVQRTVSVSSTDTLAFELTATGSAQLRIDRFRWDPPAPPWLQILQPVEGTWLQPADRVPLLLRLAPTAEERYRGTLCIEGDAECPFSACATLDIQAKRTRVAVEAPAQLGHAFLCQVGEDTLRFRITNLDGVASLTVSARLEPPSAAFELVTPTAPVQLQPGESLSVLVRIRPEGEGRFTATLQLAFEGGGVQDTFSYPLWTEFARSLLALDSDALELGSFEPCEQERTLAIPVQNIGTLTDTLTVELDPPVAAFRLQSPARAILPGQGSDTIVVAFSPAQLQEGLNVVTMRLRTLGCQQTRTVSLTATGVRARLEAIPAQLDFGTVWSGQTARQRLILHNPSPVPLRLESLEVEPPTAGFALESVPLPYLLSPGERLALTVSFTAADTGSFSAVVRITARSACQTVEEVPLFATVPEERYVVQLWLERYLARPGDTLHIPVWLRGPVQQAQLQEMAVELQFDPALLLPVQLQQAGLPLAFRWSGDGRMHFVLSSFPQMADTAVPQPVATLTGVALASLPSETPLHFASVSVTARKHLQVSTTDGWLSVLFCGIGRLIPRESAWATAWAAEDGFTVRLHSPVVQHWTVQLFTLHGRQCWHWQGSATGTSLVHIPAQALATGTYLLSVRSEHEGEILRVLLPLAR